MTKTISLLCISIMLLSASCKKRYPIYTCECKRGTGEVLSSMKSNDLTSKSEFQQSCDERLDAYVNRNGWADATCELIE